MVTLKNKIIKVDSLPPIEKKKTSPITILFTILTILIIIFVAYFSYIKLLPYIKATNINNIVGKKVFITECNTKDYIIINKDKTYSLGLTNNNCKTKHYEGTLTIKNNEIIFNKTIKGIIDSNYNIIINNNLFTIDNINE